MSKTGEVSVWRFYYYSQTPQKHKDSVTSSFEGLSGNVRVVCASTSLSMGVRWLQTCSVCCALWVFQEPLTSHLQEAGRAGRDGREAFYITVYQGRHLVTCEPDVKAAVRKSLTSCCRIAFLESFDDKVCSILPLHSCCNVCHKNFKCAGSDCSIPIPIFDCERAFYTIDLEKSRTVSEDERCCLKDVLCEVQSSLSLESKVRMFDSTGVIGQLAYLMH